MSSEYDGGEEGDRRKKWGVARVEVDRRKARKSRRNMRNRTSRVDLMFRCCVALRVCFVAREQIGI